MYGYLQDVPGYLKQWKNWSNLYRSHALYPSRVLWQCSDDEASKKREFNKISIDEPG